MKKGLKLFSFFFVVFLLLAAIATAFVVTNKGTSGFMTRAEGPSKLGGKIHGDPKPANQTTTSAEQSNVPKMDKPIETAADQSNVPKMADPIKTAAEQSKVQKVADSIKTSTEQSNVPKMADPIKTAAEQSKVQKVADSIKTTTNQSYVPIGWSFQKGFPVNQSASTKFPECPISPDVTEIGNTKVFAEGVGFYIIKLCKVHGYAINSIKAKDFDDMFTAMKAAGYSFKAKEDNFRTYEAQESQHRSHPNDAAPAGGSNHERGLAVDVNCFNASGDRQAFKPWMFGKKRGLADFEKAIAEHPCLRWIHNNAPRYKLLLMCDGKGDYGEIAVKTGGCETWHLSPTGH